MLGKISITHTHTHTHTCDKMENRIDLQSRQAMTRTKMNLQCACDTRVCVQDGAVTVTMMPDDGDGNKGCADRRRNELSIKGQNDCFCLHKGEVGMYMALHPLEMCLCFAATL